MSFLFPYSASDPASLLQSRWSPQRFLEFPWVLLSFVWIFLISISTSLPLCVCIQWVAPVLFSPFLMKERMMSMQAPALELMDAFTPKDTSPRFIILLWQDSITTVFSNKAVVVSEGCGPDQLKAGAFFTMTSQDRIARKREPSSLAIRLDVVFGFGFAWGTIELLVNILSREVKGSETLSSLSTVSWEMHRK